MGKIQIGPTRQPDKFIRRGSTVPHGSVNLAWAKAPTLSPKNNLVIVDTSRIVDENQIKSTVRKRLAFSNELGVLEDENGNQLFEDEYPIISDVFNIDEDFSVLAGNEYVNENILPFVHVSRHYHVDFAGLSSGSAMLLIKTDDIRVIDKRGNDFVDKDGNKRYRIGLVAANLSRSTQYTDGYPTYYDNVDPIQSKRGGDGAYRVYVFLDTENPNQELYVTYNKIELSTDKNFINQEINYKEICNPRTYYKYKPEETDIIDHAYSKQKWYSTKPSTLKEQILGIPNQTAEGWKIFVPRKAVGDPRIFQLFRWRVKCDFIQNLKIDPTTSREVVRCGILVGNQEYNLNNVTNDSRAAYAFINMANSGYNASSVSFLNPLTERSAQYTNSATAKQTAKYWYVNIDTVSNDDLKLFDLLLVAPNKSTYDLSPYVGKLNYFTSSLGRTLVIDTSSQSNITGFGFTTSPPVTPSGQKSFIDSSTVTARANGSTITYTDINDPIMNADEDLGGWELNSPDVNVAATISPYKNSSMFGGTDVQYLTAYPGDYKVLLQANDVPSPSTIRPVLIRKDTAGNGSIFVSTTGVASVSSMLWGFGAPILISSNVYPTMPYGNQTYFQSYNNYINSIYIEGAMKLFYNICLYATKGKLLDSSDETQYSTVTTTYGDWSPSWVINAANDTLTEPERQKYDFLLLPTDYTSADRVWQRTLSTKSIKQLIEEKLTPDQLIAVTHARRVYTIEVSNRNVSTSDSTFLLNNENQPPRAWTLADSPPFKVPADFGPHIIRDTEVTPSFNKGESTYKAYPPKNYKFAVRSIYTTTSQHLEDVSFSYSLSGYVQIQREIPPSTTQIVRTIPGSPGYTRDIDLYWTQHGSAVYAPSPFPFQSNWSSHPYGMEYYQEMNFYNPNTSRCWPFWGMWSLLDIGSSGDHVRFLQTALNKFVYLGVIPGFYLDIDGYYGSRTAQMVRTFQQARGALWVDGIVDAETWSLIGFQILQLGSLVTAGTNDGDYTRYFNWPAQRMNLTAISDVSTNSTFAKRSWVVNGPSTIWDAFLIRYQQSWNIFGVTVIPYLEGSSNSQIVEWLDVRQGPVSLSNYQFGDGNPGRMNATGGNGDYMRFNINPTNADSVVVSLRQNYPAGYGGARLIGIRDIIAHAKQNVPATPDRQVVDTIVSPGRTEIVTAPIALNNRTVLIRSGVDELDGPVFNMDNVTIPAGTNRSEWILSGPAYWQAVTNISPPGAAQVFITNIPISYQIYGSYPVSSDFFVLLRSNLVANDVSGANYVDGPTLPNTNPYYTMNTDRIIDPRPASGFIAKNDGVRLVCTSDGKPYGFPATNPNSIGANETQLHYTKYAISVLETDPSVLVRFYDINKQEFIVSENGVPEITYIEYYTRGPQNIYVSVTSNYEVESVVPFPDVTVPPRIPFKWAMPVYGVTTPEKSKIGIEQFSPDLGLFDLWSIPIRTGSFSRTINVRSRSEGALTGYLTSLQNTTVTAYYSVPETENGPWSAIYGRPYSDVSGERPIILDDNVIQVRQAPILMVQEPSNDDNLGDPWKPIVTVSVRATVNSPWVDLSMADIKDYNAFTGVVELVNDLPANNPQLVQVRYTSSRNVYQLKHDGTQQINLNPYVNDHPEWIGKPLYIYMVPQLVRDINFNIVAGSKQDRTLRFRTDATIFDPVQANYDPLAVLLGVIYITTSFDVNDLTILDTRKRGGGLADNADVSEVLRMVKEASSYWDTSFNVATSYQRGGFVIIRLPSSIKNDFDEVAIIEVIERNITAGVRYKIEYSDNLEGGAVLDEFGDLMITENEEIIDW